MIFPIVPLRRLAAVLLLACAAPAVGQVVINELHYHPVEEAAFDASGNPVLDLTDDVHEFVEILNTGAAGVDLGGWKLSGGADFTMPAGTTIPAGGFRILAKNPARLATVYGLSQSVILGPWSGNLANGGDTINLLDQNGNTVDSVSYSASFPWPASADALGADQDFTLINKAPYQYKGRSLERFSAAAAGNDPANWLASPLATGPTPGLPNTSTGAVPRPVVVAISALQDTDESPVIRAATAVRITATFGSTVSLSNVRVEYFVDLINSFTETRSEVVMTAAANGQFTAVLPGQADRSVVRYRIKADRGGGLEIVSPRADDPAIVPTGPTAREAWFAWYVQPVRTSPNPIYDIFVSDSGQAVSDTLGANNYPFTGLNGLQTMAYNITGSPLRTTATGTASLPRDVPYVTAADRQWNGSVPAVFVENGHVRDAQFRLHGSRYNRHPSRPSYKLRFADTQKYQEADSVFVTDKSDYFSVMHGLYINQNLPLSSVRWIDWYMNGNAKVTKLEQGEYNGDLLSKFHDAQAKLSPGTPKETSGEYYKSVGTMEPITPGGEGPYGAGDFRQLPAAGGWTQMQRYDWTYILQSNGWKGSPPFKSFLDGLWAARGDSVAVPNPNIPALRAYLDSVLDVDTELTSMATLNWACPWDDTTQNHFFWRRSNGRWVHFPWDFDAYFGNGDTTGTNSWIYLGEVGSPPAGILGNNFRGPNYFKDSFLKAYRTEYNNRLWILNNTYLSPANLQTLFFRNASGTQQSFYSYINGVKAGFCEARFSSVNTQTGHAADGSDFTRPLKPVPVGPSGGVTALPPMVLTASAYAHTSGNTAGANAHAKSKWEIRNSTGDYLAPAVVSTSTTSLTSFAIPFDRLTFGQTYFWRVTYFDGNTHPSLISDEVSFAFGPQSGAQTLIAIDSSTAWKFNQTANLDGVNWMAPGNAYDDSAWGSGAGLLAESQGTALPPNIRTTLAHGRTTYYFRKHFNFPGNPSGAVVKIRQWIDDGVVIYVNGVEVSRTRMNAGSPAYATLASLGVATAVEEGPLTISAASFVQGDNVIAVEVHQASAISSDIAFGLSMEAALLPDVAINEVMADNRSAVANGAAYPDWIELKNNTAGDINIGGYGLTDDILIPNRYVFPAGTIIPANGYLVVWCDNDATAPSLHTGFGLDRGGQRIVLTMAGLIRDFVTLGPQATNFTVGRTGPDGTGPFTLTTPTPGAPNAPVTTLGTTASLRINEWMAKPAHGDDWFEIYNPDPNPVSLTGLWLSDTPGTPKITQISPLSFIAGKGFVDFSADGSNAGGSHVNFSLAAGGEWIVLTSPTGTVTLDSQQFGAQAQDVSQGRFPDGSATIQSFQQTSSRGTSNWLPAPVVINEALTNSTAPFEDAIEMYNPTAGAVDVSGWWLSDDKTTPQKFQIPAGTILPAGGFKVLYENQFNPSPGIGNSFSLGSTGDEVVLSAIDGVGVPTGYRAEVSFGAAADGVSFGRVTTSARPEFWPLASHTFGHDTATTTAQFRTGTGLPNTLPKIGPVIINEVMYHPPDLVGGVDNDRDEFIELHNVTTAAANIGGWKIKSGSDFIFPADTSVRPGDYILVVGFDPKTDAASLAAFRAAYGLGTGTPVYGPFAPKLQNDEQSVELAFPGAPVAGTTPYILADKVAYSDAAPWPASADGTGPSLQRLSRTVIGNDPSNWTAAAATPGAVNSGESPILDNDGDGLPNAWEDANGLDKFNAADAAADADNDGQTNLAEYLAGTNPRNGGSFFGSTATPIAGGFQISFAQQPGRTYRLEASNSLTAASWTTLANIPASGTPQMYMYNDLTGLTRRFYRITLTP